MIQPKILLTRIDDRFIYGQDVELWNEAVGSNLVLIVNDEIAADSRKWAPTRAAGPGAWGQVFSRAKGPPSSSPPTAPPFVLMMAPPPAGPRRW